MQKKGTESTCRIIDLLHVPATADDPLASCLPSAAAAVATGSGPAAVLLSPAAAATTSFTPAARWPPSATPPGTHALLVPGAASWRPPAHGRGMALASMAGNGANAGGLWERESGGVCGGHRRWLYMHTHTQGGSVCANVCQRVRTSLWEREMLFIGPRNANVSILE
jgi:hypothetical protein